MEGPRRKQQVFGEDDETGNNPASSSSSSSNKGGRGRPLIKIRISFNSSNHNLRVSPHSTIGDLKKILAKETGLDLKDQRLFFRGKEKVDDEETLDIAGVKHKSKLLLLENQASKERKLEEMKQGEDILRACDAIARVRTEVDKLAEKAAALEGAVSGGTKVVEKEFILLTELLMRELLKLDGIEAPGEAKLQRKMEVRRIQGLVETLDALKLKSIQSLVETLDALKLNNSKPFIHRGNI